MNSSLRIAVADDEPLMREVLHQMLSHMGHEVVLSAATGRELVEQVARSSVDLIITDIKMPDMDGLDAVGEVYRKTPKPIILVSGYHDREYIERAQENHVLAYLIKPVKQADLEAAIALATRRFEEFNALSDEAADLRKALADRKVIERAKGLMMKHLRVDEAEAFRRLQKLANNKNQKLIDIAHTILTAAEALNG